VSIRRGDVVSSAALLALLRDVVCGFGFGMDWRKEHHPSLQLQSMVNSPATRHRAVAPRAIVHLKRQSIETYPMTRSTRSAHSKRDQSSRPRPRQVRTEQTRHTRSSGEHAPASKSKLKYQGTIKELRRVTWYANVRGRWKELPHGVWRFSCRDGAGMNWSSTRGTLWFDGPDPELLRQIVVAAIRAQIYRR
jgi:hypothetical protein